MRGRPCTVVPILVGSPRASEQAEYGRILSPYLGDPSNFFVVSSDFCHWGSRFQYQPVLKGYEDAIWKGIETMDREVRNRVLGVGEGEGRLGTGWCETAGTSRVDCGGRVFWVWATCRA
jgi:predicted class III extradiol MEMO1 family dioxygenase